jgi:hypothetical protein
MLVCCFNLSCLPGGAHKIAPRGAADLRACAESCWSRCIVCPRLSARHIAHGDGGKRGSHGAAGQHPYSTSSAPHTALALAVLLHPGAADARVLARVMMPAELLATPQRRCYSILTTPSEAPYTAHQGASYLRTDLPSPSAAAASGPPGTCSIDIFELCSLPEELLRLCLLLVLHGCQHRSQASLTVHPGRRRTLRTAHA